MAKKSDLEVSPGQWGNPAQQALRARVGPPSKTYDKDQLKDEENGEYPTDASENSASQEGTAVASGAHSDQQDDDDLEALAGLISDASLSDVNQQGKKAAQKVSRHHWAPPFMMTTEHSPGGSQKRSKSLEGKYNLSGRSSPSQSDGYSPQISPQEAPSNKDAVSLDKSGPGKSLTRSNSNKRDASKTRRPRRFGRPDPYNDFPQSPPRSHTSGPKSRAPKRLGLKPKPVVLREKPKKIAVAVGQALSGRESLVVPQNPVEHAECSPDRVKRVISTGGERAVAPKCTTRSPRTREAELNDVTREKEKHQRMSSRKLQELEAFHNPAPSGSKTNRTLHEHHFTRNQADAPATEPLQPMDDATGNSRSEPQLSSKSLSVEIGDVQPRGNVDLTSKKRHREVPEGWAEGNTRPESQDISRILSDPTPIKGLQKSSKKLLRPSFTAKRIPGRIQDASAQQVAMEHAMKTAAANASALENSQVEATDEEGEIESESDDEHTTTSKYFIEQAMLDQLLSIIQLTGQNAKANRRVVSDEIHNTRVAKFLTKATKRLLGRYEFMGGLVSATVVDIEKYEEEHEKAITYLKLIQEKTQSVLVNRLGDRTSGGMNDNDTSRTHILEDLYLWVIPNLVKALRAAANSHQNRMTPATTELTEFFNLLKVLYDIVKAALAEDKSIQPKAPRGNSYQITQPTRRIWQTLRQLYTECERELAHRKAEGRRQKTKPEQARKRKERIEAEQRAEQERYQRRLQERNRAILVSLNERRAELGLPPCSQPIRTPSSSRSPQPLKVEEVDQLNIASHDGDSRLTGVFGHKNTHPGTTPKEWTKVEMEILVEGLRRERGPSRYEKLAARLERTLDEIFDRAKYLKMQIEYTLKRLQEENPDKEFPPIKPWIENIGCEGFLNQ